MVVKTLSQAIGSLTSWLDFYGHPVGVHYRGSGVYKTKLGALCSLITAVLILVNTISISTKFANNSGQTVFYQRVKVDVKDIEPLVLQEL